MIKYGANHFRWGKGYSEKEINVLFGICIKQFLGHSDVSFPQSPHMEDPADPHHMTYDTKGKRGDSCSCWDIGGILK